MKKIIRKIKMYFEEKRNWNAKMSEPLRARIDDENLFGRLRGSISHVQLSAGQARMERLSIHKQRKEN